MPSSNDTIKLSFNNYVQLELFLPWLILLGSICSALIIHHILYRILIRSFRPEAHENGAKIITKSRRTVRLALVILAVHLCLPFISLSTQVSFFISQFIKLGLIGIVGGLAILVVNTFTDVTISRHRVDVEDNLQARKIRTRLRVLRQAITLLIGIITIAAMLMTFPGARSIGLSLFASAGVAGIVVGFAARPVLSNLLAGIQIALTQPIRIDDAVVIEGEWGWIEEITPTYVVIKIWDWRRLIVPLSYVIENPFQNWTRETASIIGSVTWHTDYSVPVDAMREKLKEFLSESKLWDGDVQVLQVINSGEESMELRALMSAKNSPTAWDLRCEIREKMIFWLQQNHLSSLPKRRASIEYNTQENKASNAAPIA